MRRNQHVGHDGALHEIRKRPDVARIVVRADVGIRPAVEAAVLDRRRVVGHQVVAEIVALVDRRPHDVRPGLQRQSDGIANPGRIDPIAGAIRVELEDGRAPAILAGVVVRLRPDRDVHLGPGAIEDDVARGVAAGRQIEQLLGLALRLQIAVRVLVADDRAGVADVEIAVVERHPERRGQRAWTPVGKRRRLHTGRRLGAKDRTVDCRGSRRPPERAPEAVRGAGAAPRAPAAPAPAAAAARHARRPRPARRRRAIRRRRRCSRRATP